MGYSAARWLQDIATIGEMAALQRRAKFFGFPDQPPADWKPGEQMVLLSTREQYDNAIALDRDAYLLVAEGKYAEAVARLAPVETWMRSRFKNSWLLARYLTTLGKAQSGLHDYDAAYIALDDAWTIASNFSPGSRDAHECAQAMVNLYAAWNAAEKGKGYDLKANEWKQTLATLEAANDD
jgi:hypothetical protein